MCAEKVLSKEDMDILMAAPLPECYVIKEESPGVFKSRTNNYLPVFSAREKMFGSVLGLYNQKTRVIFVVETFDLEETYRHEAQHYIFTLLDKEREDRGITSHSHKIWQHCEKQFYSVSEESKKFYKNRDLSKADIVMENLLRFSHANARKSMMSLF